MSDSASSDSASSNAAAFDPALVQRGARVRRSPYFEATQWAGCRGYTVYNHMLLPIRYDDFEAEYRQLIEGVTLCDVSVERIVEISGADGLRFAELLTPRDLSQCAVGQGRYVLLCDEAGGIVNDAVLLRITENRLWLA
jgi:aminomethyltransferase